MALPCLEAGAGCAGAAASPVGLSLPLLLLSAALIVFLAERKNLWLMCG